MSGPHIHPRPQLHRPEWDSLNGAWDFALDPTSEWREPDQVAWDRTTIQVPFAPETVASGVHDTVFYQSCWYRRRFDAVVPAGHRLMLRFEAVHYAATVWINGVRAVEHQGGYTPFRADITDLLTAGDSQEIVVRADDPHDLAKPRGKQDWQLHPHSIWYPRTTGIWQTVWLEPVPTCHFQSVRWCSLLERWEISLDATLTGAMESDYRLGVRLSVGDIVLAEDLYAVVAGEVSHRVGLSDPGIDDFRNELLWSPASPTLIQAHLTLFDANGQVVDQVDSYTAIRSISVQGNRFVLNGRPYPLRMVLDQGYWPDSGLTAPDDDTLRRDVELALAMGFNGVHKHQKIESQRYLFWADTLGLLVWEEMPSAYRFTRQSVERLTREWMDVIARDFNHPCVIAWVPFNESWGVPDLPDSPTQRHYVQAFYHLTRTLDPSRPVVGNDGWESVATDLTGIHDYDDQPHRIRNRFGRDTEIPRLFRRERPGRRLLVLGDNLTQHDQPILLTEFGGIAYAPSKVGAWGYSRVESPEVLAARYAELLAVIHSLTVFAGFCYTQFTDTYLRRRLRTIRIEITRGRVIAISEWNDSIGTAVAAIVGIRDAPYDEAVLAHQGSVVRCGKPDLRSRSQIVLLALWSHEMGLFSSVNFDSFETLFTHQIQDLYDAEQRLIKAIPLMADAANSAELKSAFEQHLRETENHTARLEQVFEIMSQPAESKTCDAMKGLIAEGNEAVNATGDPDVKDAALIAAAQRIEHYEISAYGTARAFARRLGKHEAARILGQTLEEEVATDERLTEIAEQSVNTKAVQA